MKVRDWRDPQYGTATEADVPAPTFATHDPWFPLEDEATAHQVLHDPASLRAQWAREDETERREDEAVARWFATGPRGDRRR